MFSQKFSTYSLQEVVDLLQEKLVKIPNGNVYVKIESNSHNPKPPYWYEGYVRYNEEGDTIDNMNKILESW